MWPDWLSLFENHPAISGFGARRSAVESQRNIVLIPLSLHAWTQRSFLLSPSLGEWPFHNHDTVTSWDLFCPLLFVPTGSPWRGGDVAVYVFDANQPSLPIYFYSVLLPISVFMALSTVFHAINSPDNSPLSYSVLPVVRLLYWSFQLCIYLWNSPSVMRKSFVVDWA